MQGFYDSKNNLLLTLSILYLFQKDKSIVIATYALCGFSNFGSVGIQVGFLGTLAPKKSKLFAKIGFLALLAGNIACFMTSCMAGEFKFYFIIFFMNI